jgi:hypothetical protein
MTLLTSVLAIGGLLASAGSLRAQTSAPVAPATVQSVQQSLPPTSAQPDMPMQGHQMADMQMRADKTTPDANLQALVAKMNAAKGQAKLDAIAELLAALVQQQVPKGSGMMQKDGQMMRSMAEGMSPEMKKMTAECPMMKMMKTVGK